MNYSINLTILGDFCMSLKRVFDVTNKRLSSGSLLENLP